MQLKIFQVDAFSAQVFKGNSAAVCPLEQWLSDELMQSIDQENNLSETAFFIKTENVFHIRWFTPLCEVDLCGHATLASAFVIFNLLQYEKEEIQFESRSGRLTVSLSGDWIEMNFPSQPPVECELPEALRNASAEVPAMCLKSEDYILVYENPESVINAKPDFSWLKKLDLRGVVITAADQKYDYISRCFAPKFGIDEDPVTGSSFTQLAPYWSERLKKKELNAKQVSARGGEVRCYDYGDRVMIAGKAVLYMTAFIEV